MKYMSKNGEVRSLDEAEQVIMSTEEYEILTSEELQGETVTITKKRTPFISKSITNLSRE